MSSGIVFADPAQGVTATMSQDDAPYLIEIVAPIESETVTATAAELRGDVPAERNTLGALSEAIDQQAADLRRYARAQARLSAIIFG